jgi:glycosyltransferase involved in cell wall biosynthesis
MIVMAAADAVASVVIPTRNRGEMLVDVLASIESQTVPVEVFVMDDGSTDGTAGRVRDRFPAVRVRRSETSHGPTFQRNEGARLATTPFLITIDDDCRLASPATLAQTLDLFNHQRVGAVTIPFVNVNSDRQLRTAAPRSDGVFVTGEFFGGMIAFRREVFEAAGGYRESYFMHVEESDLAVRMLAVGSIIRLGHADPIEHLESPHRDLTRLHRLGARNHLLFCWYNVPWPYLPLHLLATIGKTFLHGVRIGQPLLIMQGLSSGVLTLLRHRCDRRPLSRNTYRLARRLKKKHGPLPLAEVEAALNWIDEPVREAATQTDDSLNPKERRSEADFVTTSTR